MEPDFFNRLFDQFNTPESYTILVIMLIAFLFGLLVGILARNRRVRQKQELIDKYQKQFKDLEAQLTALQAKAGTTEEALARKDEELVKLLSERDEARTKAQMLEEEKARLYADISGINEELEKLEVSNQGYLSTIENLENQIIGLKAKNDHLARQQQETPEPAPLFPQGTETFPDEEESSAPLTPSEPATAPTADWLEAVERKLQQLEDENTVLKEEIDALKDHTLPTSPEPLDIPVIGGVVEAPPEPEFELDLMTEAPAPDFPDSDENDDLTLIKGIGPVIEKKLNDIGIHSFLQLSRLDADDIERVSREIQFFEGRIEKDDWVGQAARLYLLKSDTPEAFEKMTGHPSDPSDLKVVEGIGPKIEALLKEEGITSWEKLAASTSERLQDILDAAGEHFRIHDPTTWPAQAQLAADGNWDLLEEYQEQLKGGREEED